MNTICYIPSYNNADEVLTSVASARQFHCVIVDNASDGPHREKVRHWVKNTTGVSLVEHDQNIGRVRNWEFCVRHFVQSGAEWLKWLFAGDVLSAEAKAIIDTALAGTTVPIGLAVFGHTCVFPTRRQRWCSPASPGVRSSAETLRLQVKSSNLFDAPLGHVVHRRAVEQWFSFGDLGYSADMQFCVNIARRHQVMFADANIGEFRTSARRYWSAHSSSIRSRMQEWCIRRIAADFLLELTGDRAEHEELLALLQTEMLDTFVRAFPEEVARRMTRPELVKEVRRRLVRRLGRTSG